MQKSSYRYVSRLSIDKPSFMKFLTFVIAINMPFSKFTHKEKVQTEVWTSDHQQTPERGLEREITPSPFFIDFGGMYGEIARFYKA